MYLRPSRVDRLGQDGGGGRAVAGDVVVFSATSLTSLAPMFSKGSASSISLETVTPSLVTVGPPNDLSRITLRPVGPSVTDRVGQRFDALGDPARASSSNRYCLAMVGSVSIGGAFVKATDPSGPGIRRPRSVASPLATSSSNFARMSLSRRILNSSPFDLDVGAGVLAVDDLVARPSRRAGCARRRRAACPGRPRRPSPAAASPWRCRAARCRRPSSLRLRAARPRRDHRAA